MKPGAGQENSQFGKVVMALECLPQASRKLLLQLSFDEAVIDAIHARRLLYQFGNLICQFCPRDQEIHRQLLHKKIGDLNTVCEQDRATIWSWNSSLPRHVNTCVPELFAEQARQNAESPAVHAWDGQLTYAELDRKTTLLAGWLLEKKIAAPGRILPVCFDKTIWTTITILAIAKAGSVFVMLDPHQPRRRLAVIVAALQSDIILARPDTIDLAQSLSDNVIILNDRGFENSKTAPGELQLRRPISHADLLYIVYTSGSTGTPKGVTISHSNLCSSAAHQARALGFARSRTVDSSSYSFDAYVFNTFYTLLTGGCLCVPSEMDRINNLQASLQEMRVNFAQLTPSTSRLLDPTKLPQLKTLILTGEKINRTVLEPWLKAGIQVINVWGPTECTIMAAANMNITCVKDAESIGYGLGSTLWIADVNDITRLAPIGTVGELCIEGPIIGQGYLGDEIKTQESLLHVPAGYLPGLASSPSGPLFRTRDLARYNSDGSICFIGRADNQVKVNGARVEIGEVEYHLGQCFPKKVAPIAEVVQWPSGTRQLLAFVQVEQDFTGQTLHMLFVGLNERLSEHLPKYMIPSAYFPLDSVPMTASGKTDRKVLRRMALEAAHLLLDSNGQRIAAEKTTGKSRPMSEDESTLRKLWAGVLGVQEESIQMSDNFFSRGGDSLAAMRLVSAMHDKNLSGLTVANVFVHPRLSDLALMLRRDGKEQSDGTSSELSPFSMLQGDLDMMSIANICQCEVSDIEDMYPCSPIQEEMIVLAARNARDFVTQAVVDLPAGIDIARFMSAWDNVVLNTPILRTRVVDINAWGGMSHNFAQVVIRGSLPWNSYSDLESCLEYEREVHMGLGQPLFRAGIVKLASQKVVLTMHHAVYDGWFLDMFSRELTREYHGESRAGIVPYKNFIQYLSSSEQTEAARFWKKHLGELNLHSFPRLPNPHYKPSATAMLERKMDSIEWKSCNGITPNTLIQAAWAIVLSKQSRASDIVFGTTLLGRQISMAHIERVGGPAIATVPVRIAVDWHSPSAAHFLHTVQSQTTQIIPFMHMGIENIRRLSYDSEVACKFGTFLVIQPMPNEKVATIFDLGSGEDDIQAFNTYSLMVECSLMKDGLRIRASFDERVLESDLAEAMLVQMEGVLRWLYSADESVRLQDMPIVAKDEISQIAGLNSQGQHAQLFETEVRLRECCSTDILASAVDVVQLEGISKLVAFVDLGQKRHQGSLKLLSVVNAKLTEALPRHMIPSHYLIMPNLQSLSRPTMRQMAMTTPLDRFINSIALSQQNHALEPPRTESGIVFQRLWAKLLNVEARTIGAASSFLSLGGDSLAAMRLVAAAREEGYLLSVAEIMGAPRLEDIAANATKAATGKTSYNPVPPLSLLDQKVDTLSLAKACGIEISDIEDVYPCSPLQEAMLASSARSSSNFVSKGLIQLPLDIDVARLRHAWQMVVATTPVLRTRIVESAGRGLLQVVVKVAVQWSEHDKLDDIAHAPIGLGSPLLSFNLVNPPTGPEHPALFMTIHHAIYDRWSASLVFRSVESIYRCQKPAQELLPYNAFIEYLVKKTNDDHADEFWTRYLENSDAPQFPTLPSPKYQPAANAVRKHGIKSIKWPRNITASTALKAAWSIVISQYSNSSDVVFGSTVMGRQAPLQGIELIAGPIIATVPIRARINWESTKSSFMQTIQEQAADMIQFEHHGIDRIQRLNDSTQQACQFQSLLVIQPPEPQSSDEQIFSLQRSEDDLADVNAYALTLECALKHTARGMTVDMSFDDQVIDDGQAQRILSQFEHVLRQICDESQEDKALKDLDLLSEQDRKQIWSWNGQVPRTIESRFDELILKRVKLQPDASAVCAWNRELSYAELYGQAKKLAYHLVTEYGIGPEIAVPVCLEKSVWAPVAMLAIILAGGVVVMMDISQPIERLQSITKQVEAQLVLTSSTTSTVAQKLLLRVCILDTDFLRELPSPHINWSFPHVSPNNAMYISFTSGSTGTPKGAIITHANCCSGITHQSKCAGVDETTRTLDLASYSFDIIWFQFFVLSLGGCLCIPSDDDRRNDLAGAIRDLRVNFLSITPSLARTLDPTAVPSVVKVFFGGEALSEDDITRWRDDIEVRNAYGPTECTVVSTVSLRGEDFTLRPTLGHTYGLNAWVMSCIQPDTLAPIGALGELVLEGPLVGRGYLKNPEKTAAAFICDPPWLLQGEPSQVLGRRGRLYKTGDLVKSDGQGRLSYIGRIDGQRKIRGQRIELEETEFHARKFLDPHFSVAAEVIETTVAGQKSQVLMMFLSAKNNSHNELSPILKDDLRKSLSRALPIYLVPSAFVFLEQIPLTVSGKVDRKSLQQIGAKTKAIETRQRRQGAEPYTEAEKVLSRLWCDALGLTEEMVGRQDSFLDLGGDSLAAIRLVGAARQQGLPLSVALIFQNPQLDEMAAVLDEARDDQDVCAAKLTYHPAAIPSNLPSISEVTTQLSVTDEAIENILPVTDFQRYAINCALKKPRTELNYFALKIRTAIDIARIQAACQQLVDSVEMLRYVFLLHKETYVQVVLRSLQAPISVTQVAQSLDRACETVCLQDLEDDLPLGSPFVKFFILQSRQENETRLVIRLPHAQYDGISFPLIAECMVAVCNQRPLPPLPNFSAYITEACQRSSETYAYWQNLLEDSHGPTEMFPEISATRRVLSNRTRVSKEVHLIDCPKGITVATLFTAAWGVAVSEVTGLADVVFGRGVSGRKIASAASGLESVIGPCLNLVPVRMKLPSTATHDVLDTLQAQFIGAIGHETVGLSEIVEKCTNWPSDTDFGSVVYFQNMDGVPHISVEGNDAEFTAMQLDRPDPPEPLRLNVLPHGDGKYELELLVPKGVPRPTDLVDLLNKMEIWMKSLHLANGVH
jgi:amino acid adenylation domain-containing protein